jgi:DNA-binding NarL/FixJ family response regulator
VNEQQTAPIRVLVADDQRIVRDGLVLLLGLLTGIEVVGTASDGAEATRMAAANNVDVVLMDLRMPEMDGIEATRRLRDSHPNVRVLVLTTYADDDSLIPALDAGATGYLTKNADADTIADAIRTVHAGGTHLGADIQRRLVQLATSPTRATTAALPDDLTAREAEVLTLIAKGHSNQEIAAHLVVGTATVKTHINRIFSKTRCRDRAQLVNYAYTHNLTAPPTG